VWIKNFNIFLTELNYLFMETNYTKVKPIIKQYNAIKKFNN